MRTQLTLILCCGFVSGAYVQAARGGPLYVDDKLVLNVYAEADQSSSRVATIETGDVVEALEHGENFIRVQLADGREGWVSANYLKAQPPAIVRLKELDRSSSSPEDATKQLSAEIARVKKQNAALQAEVAELKKKLSSPPPPVVAAVPAALPSEPQVENVPETINRNPTAEPVVVVERTFWWAWLLAVAMAGIGGFAAGYQTLGKRVRERFGGVKVY